jgi:hypothetical protein
MIDLRAVINIVRFRKLRRTARRMIG